MFQHSINYFNGLNNIIFRSKSRIFRYFGEIVLSMCVTTSHMSPMWLIQVPSRSKIFLPYLKVSGEQMSIPRTTSWLQCLFASIDMYRFVAFLWDWPIFTIEYHESAKASFRDESRKILPTIDFNMDIYMPQLM